MLGFLVLLISIPIVFLLSLAPLSDFLAVIRRRHTTELSVPDTPSSLLFLVPAHNEELLISDCVRSLVTMEYPPTSRTVVVVADNCTDRTAKLARDAGARCLERRDPDRPGKPHALAWALEHLPIEEWDACVIIDADTIVDSQLAWRMAAHEPLGAKCVQAYFDLSNKEQSWLTRLASLLTRIRYERLYPLKQSAGLNCPLTGNGMCIGSDLLTRNGWFAFSLTENWELYAHYTAKGLPIDYEQDARLYSQEAGGLGQAATQRKRWLAGRTWTFFHYVAPLLRSRRIGFHQKLDALAELASPSPVLRFAAALFIVVLAQVALPPLASLSLTIATVITIIPLSFHSLAALRTHPQRWRMLGSLLLLPLYTLWRIVTALGSVTTLRRGRWTKTERM